ncbi:MAG: hypothetical protein Ct9H300mP3_09120 [Gammaproteobacteria bacterium]|nr:MAG: hypothetical protein Ct9H300mP3_09120 [Gammaproteobacteria bacterium]
MRLECLKDTLEYLKKYKSKSIYKKLFEFTAKQGTDTKNHEVLALIEDVDALRRNKRFNKA